MYVRMYSTDKLQCHFNTRQLKILPEKFSKSLVHNNCHTSTVTSRVSYVLGKNICGFPLRTPTHTHTHMHVALFFRRAFLSACQFVSPRHSRQRVQCNRNYTPHYKTIRHVLPTVGCLCCPV